MNVDQYIGGVEHATKHLIYARFFTKMLRDWGWIPKGIDEPFARLLEPGHGRQRDLSLRRPRLPLSRGGQGRRAACTAANRSPSGASRRCRSTLKNVVEPLSLIEKYGADTVRIFSLFAAPPDSMLEWSDAGVEGAWRFLNRVYRMVEKYAAAGFADEASAELKQKTHATIKRVSEDVESFKFNTAIAAIMELVNAIYAATAVDREAVESVVRLLAPMAPHLCEEMWRRLGHDETQMLVTHAWPTWDEATAAKKRLTYPVQVNGKLRGQLEAEPEAAQGGDRVGGARARLGQAVARRQGRREGGVRAGAAHQLRRARVAPASLQSSPACSVAVAGCGTPEYAVVGGQRLRRPTLSYGNGTEFQLVHRRAFPGVFDPARGRDVDDGTLLGHVCSIDVRFDASWYGPRLDAAGLAATCRGISDFTHTEGLFAARPRHHRARTRPSRRMRRPGVARSISTSAPSGWSGDIGARQFTLAADGDYLIGRIVRARRPRAPIDEPFVIYGRQRSATMVPADEALILVMMLTCNGPR